MQDALWWLLVPIGAVGFWMLIGYVLSLLGGWHALAQGYAARTPFTGDRRRFRSAMFGRFVNYNRCLTLGTSATGLYMAVFPLLRAAHHPLFIPWTEMTARQGRHWGVGVIEFRCAGAPGVGFRLTEASARPVLASAGTQLTLQGVSER